MAAPTVTKIALFSVGNKRQSVHKIVVGAASSSGVVDTGLGYVDAYAIGPISMTTGAITIKPNLSSSATAVNGRITFNSSAAGDEFYITCYGK